MSRQAGAPPAPVFLVDERRGAEYLGVSTRSMQDWRRRGGGPPFIRISSRCVRYRLADLEEWAAARVRTSTSDVGEIAAVGGD